MSVKISELPILDSPADNDVLAGVDTSANVTKKIELATLKNYIDTNTTYTAGTNIDITNNVVSAPNVYNKTEVDEQIEELQSEVDSLNTIYNAFPTVSGEGESVSLDGTAETKFKKIDLKGNTSQNGTPTPSSPIPVNVVSGDNSVVVCGKNLFDKDRFVIGGVYEYFKFKESEDTSYYTLSIKLKEGGTSKNISIGFADGYTVPLQHYKWLMNSGTITGATQSDGFTSTTNLTINVYTSYIVVYKGSNTLQDLFDNYDIQLVKGDTYLPYDPYIGVTYNIDLPIENLINLNNPHTTTSAGITATYDTTKNEVILNGTSTGTVYISFNINTIPSGTVVSYGGKVQTPNNNIVMRLANGDNAKNTACYFKSNISKVENETLDSDINRIYFILPSGITLTNYVIQPSITLGSVLKGFTPYGTTPIELCKIGDYQDYFYKSSGKWYLHKEIGKVVLNGSENWSRDRELTNSYRFYTSSILPNSIQNIGMSNYFKSVNATTINTVDEEAFCRINVGQIATRINKTIATTTSDLATWLSEHLPIFYYVLETPTDTEVTYQPLIEQLNAFEKAMSYNGQTNISQVNNDKPFIISAEAIASLQNVLDRVTLLES